MASKRRIRRMQCGTKVRHPDQKSAVVSIAKLHRRRGYQGFMHAYHCRFCGGWHTGHVQNYGRVTNNTGRL